MQARQEPKECECVESWCCAECALSELNSWDRVSDDLQGFLLPGFLIKNRTTVQEKAFHGRAAAVFRHGLIHVGGVRRAPSFRGQRQQPGIRFPALLNRAGATVATLHLATYGHDTAQICRRLRSLLHGRMGCHRPSGPPCGNRPSMADAIPAARCPTRSRPPRTLFANAHFGAPRAARLAFHPC